MADNDGILAKALERASAAVAHLWNEAHLEKSKTAEGPTSYKVGFVPLPEDEKFHIHGGESVHSAPKPPATPAIPKREKLREI